MAQEILDLPEEAILVLKDFGHYLQSKRFSYFDVVIAWLGEVRDVVAGTGRTVMFLGPDFEIPPAVANGITSVDFRLPDDAAIEASVRFALDGHEFDAEVLPSIVSACRGIPPGAWSSSAATTTSSVIASGTRPACRRRRGRSAPCGSVSMPRMRPAGCSTDDWT